MNGTKLDQRLFIIIWIINFLTVLFMLFNYPVMVSKLFYLMLIVLVFLFIHVILTIRMDRYTTINLLLLFFIIILSLCSVLTGNISFNYLKKYFLFSATLIYFFLATNINISKGTIKFVIGLNIVLGILYSYFAIYHPIVNTSNELILTFSNPNALALWVFPTAIIIFISLNFREDKVKFLFSIVILSSLMYVIYTTGSRTILISSFVFIILNVFFKSFKKIPNVIVLSCILFPFLFSIIYVYLYKLNFIYSGLLFNKDFFSGREEIWTKVFDNSTKILFVGNYGIYTQDFNIFQLHNTHVDMIGSFGYLVFILVMVYLIRLVNQINNKILLKFHSKAILAFLVAIFMGIGEGALFAGGLGLFIFVGTLLIFARQEKFQ